MPKEADNTFYDRADEHLRIAHEHLAEAARGRVSASMMYSCARFNAWVSASNCASGKDLKDAYGETIEYFVAEYRKMLVRNLDDFVDHFDEYMEPPAKRA